MTIARLRIAIYAVFEHYEYGGGESLVEVFKYEDDAYELAATSDFYWVETLGVYEVG